MKFSLNIKYINYILICLVLLSGVYFCRYFFPREEKVLAPPLKKPEKIVYDTIEVIKGDIINKLNVTGYFISERQVDHFFTYRGGFIHRIYVHTGEYVKAGQILAELDTDDLNNEIEKQKFVINKAEGSLNHLHKLASVEIKLAELELKKADKEWFRAKNMQNTMSKSELENYENQFNKQGIQLEKTKINYEKQIFIAENELNLAKLQLDKLNLELEKARLKSKISGKIDYIAPYNEGEEIKAYRTFVRVADPGRLLVQYQDEYNHYSFQLGMKVNVVLNSKEYRGEVVMTPREVTYEDLEKLKNTVRVRCYNLPKGIKIGESVTIEAILAQKEDVIVLNKNLLNNYGGRRFVKVIENDIIRERDVKVGLESTTECEIISGLEVGEQVVR